MNGEKKKKVRMIILGSLTFTFMIIELYFGISSPSLSLTTDAFHMLSDVIALIVGFVAIVISPKKWDKNTFGWARAQVLGALVNAIFLLALCFTIFLECIKKFIDPEIMKEPFLILIVSVIGLVINIFGLILLGVCEGESDDIESSSGTVLKNQNRLTRILPPVQQPQPSITTLSSIKEETRKNSTLSPPPPPPINQPNEVIVHDPSKDKHKNLNTKGVFLHLFADTLVSLVAIIVSGVIYILQTFVWKRKTDYEIAHWKWVLYLDPLLSILSVSLIFSSTIPLIQETSKILLQNVPPHLSIKTLKEDLEKEVGGISGIHKFHVWQLVDDRYYASIHVRCRDVKEYERIVGEINVFFSKRDVFETTIQAEIVNENDEKNVGSTTCLASSLPNLSTTKNN